MGKSLVIVESPAKAKTINKYLGKNYIVKSSVGHVRDLPTNGSVSKRNTLSPAERGKLASEARKLPPKEREARKKERAWKSLTVRMGLDPEKGWNPKYEIVPGKEKVVSDLIKLAKNADTIYLATDLDREGEAIAWHLREAIGGKKSIYKRVLFNEITKKAIQGAFDKPTALNLDRVNAQQTRRFLDRVVGYMLSPLLWKKLARGLSAGRVQSVAVRLVVDREREIRVFVPEEYWEIHCDLATKKQEKFRVHVSKHNGENFRPNSKEQTDIALNVLENSPFTISKRETKPSSSRPRAPFITSTLQQAASTRLNYGVKKTMMMAQRLYEAGYITYMRTDSTNLSADSVDACRTFVSKKYGSEYIPEKPINYASRKGAQEAHEAIRPTDVKLLPTLLPDQNKDILKMYELIWQQFVACQMSSARFDNTTLFIAAEKYEMRANGRTMKFDGWMKVIKPAQKNEDEAILPMLAAEDTVNLLKLDPSQHFTKAAPRYSEASLVRELEKRGIGRPSTYASIISTIQDRGYVCVQSRRFYAEKIGEIVTDRLVESFSELMDFGFTSSMEEQLDAIAEGHSDWLSILDSFYTDFKNKLNTADNEEHGMRPNNPTLTDISCPNCGRKMIIRIASTGVFLGCEGYNLPPKEKCKNTINLIPGDEVTSDDEDSETNALRKKRRCTKCGVAMSSYLIDENRRLHVCGNNPDCTGHEVEQGSFRIKGYDGPSLECDKCGAEMQLKTGRFGKYFGCTNTECKNTRKLLKSGEPAPPKADPVHMPELKCVKTEGYFVLRDSASGIFLASSEFPKSRETRPVKISELLAHRGELDPKHLYLCDAPEIDNKKNSVVIRYSRKNKEQYVMSEKDGKATGWSALYQDKKWVVQDKPSTQKKKKTSRKKSKKS